MSDSDVILGLSAILVLGVAAQWCGRRTGVPSVLLLLPAGILAGDILDVVDPQELFGDLLFPGVTLAVSLLLFQSGLQLRVSELPSNARRSVALLVTVGLALTFAGGTVAVTAVVDVPMEMAFLAGAILVVSGPTVVGPLLRVVRTPREVEGVLTWESAALDPIGAALGVVVLNLVIASDRGAVHPILQLLGRLGVGVTAGVIAALLFVIVMSRLLVTDEMEAAVSLLFAVGAFAAAEILLSEAGLFATLTMGFAVGNQRLVPTARVVGFGETLEVLIIGSLFIVLGALVDIDDLIEYAPQIAVIVVVLVLVVRPISAAVCLIGSPFAARPRLLIGAVDPRGVVAAATAAQFTGTLGSAYDTDFLLPVVFGVIIGTGVVYSIVVPVLAQVLGLRRPEPRRVALIGDDPWLVEFARCLVDAGAKVLVVTPDAQDVLATTRTGSNDPLETTSLRDGAQQIDEDLDRVSLHSALVSSRPDAVVSLVEARLIELLGRRHVLQVPDSHPPTLVAMGERFTGPPLAGGVTRQQIADKITAGATIGMLEQPSEEGAIALAAVRPDGRVDFFPRSRPDPDAVLLGVVAPAP